MVTRPPLARIKKSLFDILSARLPGTRVLDVYAGSGSFGLEAISRGAAEAVLVESWGPAARAIRDNISRLGLEGNARLMKQDAESAMSALAESGSEFDVIFLDPPFGANRAVELLSLVARLLAAEGLAVLRGPRARHLPTNHAGLILQRIKTYGASQVGFYGRVSRARELYEKED